MPPGLTQDYRQKTRFARNLLKQIPVKGKPLVLILVYAATGKLFCAIGITLDEALP